MESSFKDTIFALSEMFNKRMIEFEQRQPKDIQKGSSNSPVSTSSLAAEFESFKTFIIVALKSLQRQAELLDREVDRLEMRRRRKMLLLHGVPEEQSEDTTLKITTLVADHLELSDFSSSSIKSSYRLGRPSDKKPRPIAIKFTDAAVRDKVWFAKTKLKGSGITQSEFLTKTRHQVFLKARQRFGVVNCWTRDGIIHIMALDGERHRAECLSDLEGIPHSTSQSSPQVKSTASKPADQKQQAASRTRRAVKPK